MHLESRLLTGFSQCPDEILPVHIVLEYLLAPIPAAHDVVNGSGKLHSQLARHGRTLRFPSSPIKTMLWLTPVLVPLFLAWVCEPATDPAERARRIRCIFGVGPMETSHHSAPADEASRAQSH
jgi:hypothetical protein